MAKECAPRREDPRSDGRLPLGSFEGRIDLTDDAQITFGENAEAIVLQYRFNPFVSEQKGVVVVDVKRGAFLLTTGRSSQIEVKTALADLTGSALFPGMASGFIHTSSNT